MTGMKWAAWCNVVAGALLVVAPFALGYYTLSDVATYEAIGIGLLIGVCALWPALSKAAPAYLDYIVALAGGWSIAAPFVLGYHNTVQLARNTDIGVGVVVAAIALLSHFSVSPFMRQKAAA